MSDKVSLTVGERIADLRHSLKLSQRELAEKTGISKSAISSYEAGDNYPPPERMRILADFFDVTVDYIIGRYSHAVSFPTYEKNAKIIARIDRLTDDQRKSLDEYLLFLESK